MEQFRFATPIWVLGVVLVSGLDASAARAADLIPVPADYLGTGGAQIAVYRPASQQWSIRTPSGQPLVVQFGAAGDEPVPGDYLKLGRAQIAVHRPSTHEWFIRSDSGTTTRIAFGTEDDAPVPSNYFEPERVAVAMFRLSTAQWSLRTADGRTTRISWGSEGDLPVPADYLGTGRAQVAVFRPSSTQWIIRSDQGNPVRVRFGGASDLPVPADYSGNSRAQMALFRPSTARWYLRSDAGRTTTLSWGAVGDIPVPGDYLGLGRAQLAVFRPSTHEWLIRNDNGGTTRIVFGAAASEPLPPIPVAPSSLTASVVSQTQIDLAWKDNSSGEDGFKIERKHGTGAFAIIGTVGRGGTSYPNSGLTASTRYTYRVRAYKGPVSSAFTGEASATTSAPPANPSTPSPGPAPSSPTPPVAGPTPPPPPVPTPTPAPVLAGKYVAMNGSASGQGTLTSPWDLASTLAGQRPIAPGETLWIRGGTYQKLVRPRGTGFPIRIAGTAGAPIHIRPYNGERVTIDGGISIEAPSNYLWIWDLEIIVSSPHDPPISPDASPTRPSGGFHVYAGNGCKFINLVVHGGDEGCGFWQEATNSEIHGCIFYDTGFRYTDPEASGGHAIYTQNNTGIKTISDNLILDRYGNGYSIHAYGSEGAFVNNYHFEGNIVQNGGPFLVGGGRPSSGIEVLNNYLYSEDMRIGYYWVAGLNDDCEVRDNIVADGTLDIIKYQSAVNIGNLVLAQGAARPAGARVILRPNKYDPRRANLAIYNWARTATVAVNASSFLAVGDRYRVVDPRNFFGTPLLTGTYNGAALSVPVAGEFGAFVLLKS